MKTEKYQHHDRTVHVVSEVKGKHREHCLCHSCGKFKPGKSDNCVYAQHNYTFCLMPGGPMVVPVYECEDYVRKEEKEKVFYCRCDECYSNVWEHNIIDERYGGYRCPDCGHISR